SYQSSIIDSVAAFYSGLRSNKPLDLRIDGESGRKVVTCATELVRAAKIERSSSPPIAIPSRAPTVKPSVLVIGGSGFIGRELVRQLLASGYSVRSMARNVFSSFDARPENLEIVCGDLRNESDLQSAMQGIEFVYDLAVSSPKTWDESIRDIVEPTRL